tara:strand:+ start:474 stop:686 length:213 start_codon:yes stop_codon:yes gene_type:complete
MADNSFGLKKLEIVGSGTPTIESPDGGNLQITAGITTFSGSINAANLPTSDPGIAGRIWRSGNDLKISTG